ncbi:MAG: CPBP family intramembrane metalloprotease [Candidatus Melainabacteria bacterium]|nr:CPBP family intramembrane metalloprotease [Candidatus Melainabacteria bacterium]
MSSSTTAMSNGKAMSKTSIVFLKELKEVLRDYRTLIMMIIIPTLFYPAMLVFPATFAKQSIARLGQTTVSVGVIGDCELLLKRLQSAEHLKVAKIDESDYAAKLKSDEIDVAILVPPEFTAAVSKDFTTESELAYLKNAPLPALKLVLDTNREKVLFSMASVYSAIGEFQEDCIRKRLRALHVGDVWERETKVTFNDVSPKQSDTDDMLPQFAPYLMILMVLLATSYPAIDLITGERQRGTLALLLVAPVERRSIMYGKIMVVVVVGALTTILGVISIAATLQFGPVKSSVVDAHPQFDFGVTAWLLILLVMSPLVVFISSLSVYVAALTRTFQQAQGYLFPLLLVTLFLASAAQIPELADNTFLKIVPIANTTLCVKQIITRHQSWSGIAITFFSSAIAAALLAKSAAGLLQREDLLMGVQLSPKKKMETGSYGRELVVFGGIVFFMLFYFGQLLSLWNIMASLVITQIFLILCPALAFLRYTKSPVRETLSFKRPPARFVIAALCLGFATVVLSMLILTVQTKFLPYSEEYAKQMQLMVMPPGRPLWQIILVAALIPALCEEIFFRGVLQGILRKNLPKQKLIIVIGILFGIFHLSMFRILPTGILGILLAYLTLASGSIFPSMCLHFMHNGYYLWASYYKVELDSTLCFSLAFVGLVIAALALGWKPSKEEGK